MLSLTLPPNFLAWNNDVSDFIQVFDTDLCGIDKTMPKTAWSLGSSRSSDRLNQLTGELAWR